MRDAGTYAVEKVPKCAYLVISSPSRSTTGLATLIFSAAILSAVAVETA